MKINPAGNPDVTPRKNTVRKNNGDFTSILQKETARIDSTATSKTTAAPLQPFVPIVPCVDKQQTFHIVDSYVSLLEKYERALADDTVSLKDMAPVVQKLADETERMKPFLDSLAPDDCLRLILNRALVTATVETIKFNRGDYIA